MTLDHALIEELMAVDALGGLDGDDREVLERTRAEHGDCAECRAIEDGFAETAGRLGFTLAPVPVGDAMVDEIVGRSRDEIGGGPDDELTARRSRPSRGWLALVAAAVVAALLVVAVTVLRPSTTSITQASPSQRVVTFTGDGEGTLAMAYTPGQPGAVFWGRDLPDPGPGKVYEIWMIEDEEATPGGCVAPTNGVIAMRVDANIGTTDTMAVTAEPSDCPAAPTSPPVLLADLTAVV